MAFSRGAMIGQLLGGGFTQGLNQELMRKKALETQQQQQAQQFQNLIGNATTLAGLPEGDPKNIALSMAGAAPRSPNLIEQLISGFLGNVLPGVESGMNGGGTPTQNGVGNIIRQSEQQGFGVYELNGEGYEPSSKEQVDALVQAGARKVQ